MVAKWYKKYIWGWTLHRPWTYAIRQTPWKRIGLVVVPVVTGLYTWAWIINPWAMLLLTLGIIGGTLVGHFWWDTKGAYLKHEEDFNDNTLPNSRT